MSAVITYDAESRHYFRDGFTRLYGVGTVIRETWPVKPSWEGVDMAVVENARDRGVVVDELFSGWLNGTVTAIPPNTREDARDRFLALMAWWRDQGFDDGEAEAQIQLADDEVIGIADICRLGYIWDVKNTAQIESTYSLQLGGYADLYEKQHGVLPKGVGVIHVTQAKDKPVKIKLVEFEVLTAVSEWRMLRAFWQLVRRKTQ